MLHTRAPFACSAIGLVLAAGLASAQPSSYVIHRAGLYGPDYTSNAGVRNTTGVRLGQSGVVGGRSERYLGTATTHGFAAWVYEGGGTARVGFIDAAHTSQTGDQVSSIAAINASGVVAGSSTRYVGTQTGATAWTVSNGAYTRIGLTEGVYTSATGLQSSTITALNNSGQLVGHSIQYVNTTTSLALPWLYDHGVYTTLGLTDADHTRSDGFRSGSCVALNDAGDVVGRSGHYSGTLSRGTSTWLRHNGTTARVGLTAGAFTGNDGSQFSDVFGVTADGRAVGTSDFYVNGSPIGTATWVADLQATTRVGLFDEAHTSSTGQQLCYTLAVNRNGHVIGRAFRYAGGQGSNGESAWVYSNGTSVRVGLTGVGYADANGFEYSQAQFVNDRGEVAGNSTMVTPQWSGGPAVWIYRAGQTVRIGLFDALHTNPSSGMQSSFITQLNARGDVIGTSSRFVRPLIDTEGWYYDRASDTVVPLLFSVATGGDAASTPMLLTDDGTVYGRFSRYNGATYVGEVLFRWSLSGGMQELAPLVQGGLASAGWQSISTIYGAGTPGTWDHGTIAGIGRLTGETASSTFVLTAGPICGTADFNCDGEWTDTDIEAFFACLAGNCPVFPCTNGADFNGDGDAGTDADIEAFFRVLAGGGC